MASVPHMSALDVDDDAVLLAPEEEAVPEHDVHRILVDLLAAGLARRFATDPEVTVFSRLGWFPDREDTRIRLDPDVMVVRGRLSGYRKSLKVWIEGGVAPALIIEVWSEADTDVGYHARLARMRKYGVDEVVIVDPFALGGVRVEHLAVDPEDPAHFRAVATSVRDDQPITIASLGIAMAGGRELYVEDDGERWLTTAEAAQRARDETRRANREALRALQAAQRAEQEAERATQEAERATQESERADRLAAQLRAAGIEPAT